jgi:hypothetical protein
MSDQSTDDGEARSRQREWPGAADALRRDKSSGSMMPLNGVNIIPGKAQFRMSSGAGLASDERERQTAEPISSGQSVESESSSQSSRDEPQTRANLTQVKSGDTSAENNSTDDSSKNQDSAKDKSTGSKTDRSTFRKGKWTVSFE